MASKNSVRPSRLRGSSFTERARRAQIVDETIRVISDEGFSNASLGAIAERLNISKGVISYHFENKEELIEHLIQRTLDEVADSVDSDVESAKSATEWLANLIRSSFAWYGTHHAQAMALIEIQNGRGSNSLVSWWEKSVTEIEKALRVGQRRGEFRPFPTRTMAITIRASLDIVPKLMAGARDLDLDGYAEDLVDLFLAGDCGPTTGESGSPVDDNSAVDYIYY